MSQSNKLHKTSGYCQETREKKTALMKHYSPAGDWRQIHKTSNKIVMTYLLQTWNYSDEELGTVEHLCPWGIKDTITSMLSDKKCKNKPVLLLLTKNLIENKKYDKDLMKISVKNIGLHASRENYGPFC